MNKKYLTAIIVFVICNVSLTAQSFETKLSRRYDSNYCVSERVNFLFDGGILKKTDVLISLTEEFASRLERSNYEDNGYYYEIWSPSWFLNNFGVQDYGKLTKRAYKLLFNERGGNLLYIYEFDIENGARSGKFFFTEQGREVYCK